MIPFLLVLLWGFVMACSGAGTSTPDDSPTETPEATVTPSKQAPEATIQPETASPVAGATATSPVSSATSTTPVDTPLASPESSREPPTATVETPPQIEGPMVKVGDAVFPVELALTGEEQFQGLSGREVLPPGTGMLFIYEQESRFSFWMKEMQFPLDIVWIGANCTVVDVALDVPPPEQGQTLEELPRFSPKEPVQYVLEINAGEFSASGIGLGDPVQFAGDLAGRYGC